MIEKIIAVLLLAFCLPAHAVVLQPSMGIHNPASLSGQMSYLQDASGLLTIKEVSATDKVGKFVKLPEFLEKGFTYDTYWLKFTLQRTPETTKSWFLEVAPSYLDDLILFVPQDNGNFDQVHLGDNKPYTDRPVPHRNFVFPITLTNDHPVTFYLRVKTSSTMRVKIAAWQFKGLIAETQTDTSLYSIYFGISTLGFLANLIFWLWLRERTYLYYCIYLASLTLLMACTGGFSSQVLFPNMPILASRMVGITIGLTDLIGLTFFVSVFNLREHLPRLNPAFYGAIIFYAACTVASALGYYSVIAPWLSIVALTFTTGLALAGPWLLWRGYREYLLYTLAFAASYFSIIWSLARLMGWIPTYFSSDYSIMLGTTIHISLLYFAVAERVQRSEREKKVAENLSAKVLAEFETFKQQRQFVASISHEFRTPMSIIQAATQSISLTCSQTSCSLYNSVAKRQEMIQRAIIRVLSLLDNYLTGERLELYDGEIKKEAIDMRDLVSATVTSWQNLLSNPSRLKLNFCKKAVPVNVDHSMMVLVLSNLIDNAQKYSPPDSPIKLNVGTTKTSGWVEVEDFGTGINKEEINTIFDKFYRSSNAQKVPGAGLGLNLVRSIIQKHDGKIEVHSELGKGSRFRLYIPLRKKT